MVFGMFHPSQGGKTMRKLLLLLAVIVSSIAMAIPAMASGTDHEIGTNAGSPITYLNAWNGGPDWGDYTTGVLNNAVIVEGVNRCNNGNYTTPNCPVAGVPGGLFMYQIVDNSITSKYEGQCVAAELGVGAAVMGACNTPNYGGADGTVQISYHAACPSGYNQGINSFYTGVSGGWSNRKGIAWSPGVTEDGTILSATHPLCLNYISF